MNFVLLLFSLMTAFKGFAAEKNQLTQSNISSGSSSQLPYFDKLADMYNSAHAYNVDSVPNDTALVGRCFTRGDEDIVGTAILIRNVKNPAGPISSTKDKEIAALQLYSAEFYDDKSYGDLLLRARNESHFYVYSLDSTADALMKTFERMSVFYRADGRYVYKKVEHKDGSTYYYCYYFITVH